jgi:hypothetical protein
MNRDFGLQGMCAGHRRHPWHWRRNFDEVGARRRNVFIANYARNDAAAEALRSASVGEGSHWKRCGRT